MAYALRYYKEIAQTDGGVVRLEIHKKDSTTSAVEIGAVVQGLSLEIQGQQDDIDTPIQKTSLHMTFVDASDIENGQKNGFWQEFYTPDALLWRVILKAKDAGETSFRTIWGGYVTPDSFSEDLVYRGSVSITARDNIGHMQDFPFDALGDEDGLISLFNLVSMGWEKIHSPMDLLWNGLDWLSCNDVIAYHTLMNVSQFKDMNWYKAIETALASYGAVMRYAGGNEVYVTTLRYMPSLGRNINLMDRIEPTFIAGAQRELVPAVKRIEENVKYDLEESVSQPQIKVSDFSGSTETYRCKIDGVDSGNGSFGTAEHDAPIWSINNTESWANTAGKSLFFNPHAYEIGYFSDRRGLGDEIKRFMYIAANNVDERSVSFSKTITCADLAIRIKFGLPISLNSEGGSMTIEQQNVFNLKSIRYSVTLVQNGVTNYLANHGGWVVDKQEITTDFDTSSQVSDFECIIGMGKFIGQADLTFTIHKIEYAQMSYANLADYGLYACIQDFALATPTSLSLREKNTVNTLYNADNNVILSRDPEIGPAFDRVALPDFIKNGIFYRNGDEILPARLWSWGGSEQQMAVWNHLQLLCYYAKPNNLISGTIVNADITRVAAIYEWGHAEHILVSGRYNFLNGHIEGAVLREFARYEDMWSEVAGAGMPETEQDSRSNVEGGASAGGSSSTYTNNTTVNIGTGGIGGGVDLSGYAKKEEVATLADLLASMWSLDEDGNLVTDRNVIIKKNLTIGGDTSTGGTGTDQGVAGTVTGIRVDANTILEPTNGIVDMSDVLANLEVDVDLSDYYTSVQTDAQIANAVAGLNLGQYAKASDLETLQGEVDNIEAVLGMDEEAAGIINTWNEVKAFLDGYSSSDDLAAILSAMNADIAKRALDSDLEALALTVGDNTTNIRNIKDSVYTKEDLATYKSWWDDLKSLIIKEGNDIKIKTNLIIAGDTSSGGTGSDPEVAGTLIGIKVNGQTYDKPVNGILTIPDYPTSLEWSEIEGRPTKVSEFFNDSGYITSAALVGYATQSWVNEKGYITGIDKSMVASAVGSSGNAGKVLSSTGGDLGWVSLPTSLPASDVYAWAKKSSLALVDVPNLSWNKITSDKPTTLSGYGITDNVAYRETWNNFVHTGNEFTFASPAYSGVLWMNYRTASGNTDGAITEYRFAKGAGFSYADIRAAKYIVNGGTSSQFLKADGSLDSTAYLPLSGGEIQSVTYGAFGIKRTNGAYAAVVRFSNSVDGVVGYIGVGGSGNTQGKIPFFGDGTNEYNLIHSGNSTSYNAGGLAHSNGTVGAVVNSSGNVTIGNQDLASTNYKLYVDGKMRLRAEYNDHNVLTASNIASNANIFIPYLTYGFSISYSGRSGSVYMSCGNNDGSALYNILLQPFGGNVLIGTTTDSGYKLDVAGTARCGKDEDGADLLVFNMGREWRFQQSGVGASAALVLRTLQNGRYFHLRNNANETAFTYVAQNSANRLYAYCPTEINSTLAVNGAVTMSSTLTVSGQTTINGNLVVAGDISA